MFIRSISANKISILLFFFTLIFFEIPLTASFGRENALDRIKSSGEITMVTMNGEHCYYNYRDNPAGFEYDLGTAFSNYLGVKLKVITPAWEGLFDALKDGKGDFIAASMTITPSREKRVDFSKGYLTIQQLAIIHENNREIKELEDLKGNTIHIRSGTSYEERLNELKNDGLDIKIKPYDDILTEELFRKVAEKEIQITIADSNIAQLNKRYYPDIETVFPIEEPQSLGWPVKKGEKALLIEIDNFFKEIKESGIFQNIYQKYYTEVEVSDYTDIGKYRHRIKTILPKYKRIIKRASKDNGFDWRLISAVVYEESRFDPSASNYMGERGMMQLTPTVALEMGIKNPLDPAQSIMGGVKYLKKIYERYGRAKDPDRMFITLASYNVGHGHILDAQVIAKDRGLDPNSWSALKQTLPLLRYPKYYKKARYGYCRGTEPVRYVSRILTYYDILR